MEDISSRAVIIGVSIIVTLVIVSLLLGSFDKVKEIMGLTKKTETSIHSTIDTGYSKFYSKYDGKSFNGMELTNLLKSLEDDPQEGVHVEYPRSYTTRDEANNRGLRESVYLKQLMKNNSYGYGYEKEYDVTVREENQEIYIIFN